MNVEVVQLISLVPDRPLLGIPQCHGHIWPGLVENLAVRALLTALRDRLLALGHYSWRRKATRAVFSRGVSCTPRTRLKNSTVSSSVRSRPSCRYGGESLIPRRVKVLMGPSA